ncbi:MAG: transposase [Candidatus Bathyarchaeota archaeon]|nr:transposase [Candidatus Termiticorpusculum sp.]
MMFLKEHCSKIEKYLPVQRKRAIIDDYVFLSAIFYALENGCKWRALPKEFENWHTIYVRFSRWSKNGYLQRIFEALQKEGMISSAVEVKLACLDSTHIKVHPDASGALKKVENNALDVPKAD